MALHSFRLVKVGLALGLGSLLASSCVVDKSGFVFDDDQFEEAQGTGGSDASGGQGGQGGQGSGGETSASGGLGGETSTGGAGTGGMGGGSFCEPNAMQCNEQQVELCSGDQWIAIGGPCPNACVDGLCTGVCSPGADECLSSIQTQQCNDVGEWEDEFCEFACVGGTCGGVCRPGDRDCTGDMRILCGDDGQWVDQDTCPGDCEAGVCVGACTAGTYQCGGDAENPVEIECNGTSWETSEETPCNFICEEATGRCGGDCLPFSSECATGTSVRTCDSTAHWGEPVQCDYICDPNTDACGGECDPGDERCYDDTVETCDETGNWTTTTTCSDTTPVCLEQGGVPKCVECTPRTTMCHPNANQVLTCTNDGAWPNGGEACPGTGKFATVCFAGVCEGIGTVCDASLKKRGCIDTNTRWFCQALVEPPFDTADCTLLTPLCTAGVCGK